MTTVPFGEWAPDQPGLVLGVQGGLVMARDVVPIVGGYGPRRTLLDKGLSAIDSRARGAGLARKAGATFNFVGTAGKLYQAVSAGVSDLTRTVGGGYTLAADAMWWFAVLGNTVLAVQKGDQPQYYDLSSSTAFDDLADPPLAATAGIVRQFAFLGNLLDGSDAFEKAVQWSAIGNAQSWPTPGTDAALSVQSGRQSLDGGEGAVQRILGNAEVGLILLERGLYRADFVGSDVAFDFTQVEPDRGLLTPGAACAKARIVLYFDEDGWWRSDFSSSVEVGKGRVNEYFLNDLAPADVHRISMAADPETTRFYIGYRSSSASTTHCDKLLIYDYALNKWTHGEESHELICRTLELIQTLDDLGSASLDDLGSTSLDDFVPAGPSKLGAWGSDHKLKTFAGSFAEALIETGDLTLFGHNVGLINAVRPLVVRASPTVAIAPTMDLGDARVFAPATARTREGVCPQRAMGRHHRFRITVPAGGFEQLVGLDVNPDTSGASVG